MWKGISWYGFDPFTFFYPVTTKFSQSPGLAETIQTLERPKELLQLLLPHLPSLAGLQLGRSVYFWEACLRIHRPTMEKCLECRIFHTCGAVDS